MTSAERAKLHAAFVAQLASLRFVCAQHTQGAPAQRCWNCGMLVRVAEGPETQRSLHEPRWWFAWGEASNRIKI